MNLTMKCLQGWKLNFDSIRYLSEGLSELRQKKNVQFIVAHDNLTLDWDGGQMLISIPTKGQFKLFKL